MGENRGLKIDTRRNRILELLAQKGEVRVSELSGLFHTTEVTIRSDLSRLEADGYLQRVAGGAVQTVKNYYNLDYLRRSVSNMEMKSAVARAAVGLIHDGETLMINSGVTMSCFARELTKRRNLNIVTNSLTVAMELGSAPTFRVILLGGDINVHYAFVHGPDALEQLEHYKADHAILSVDGICAEAGLTTYHAEEAPVGRTMIRRARAAIVAADASKIGHESFSSLCGLRENISVVTNDCADEDQLKSLAGAPSALYVCDADGALLTYGGDA